ncbi:MAG: hypothetical protein IJ367_02730, partial [Clostridia bacterium]|nr:hypothetical protein [Clostridia bacterium]
MTVNSVSDNKVELEIHFSGHEGIADDFLFDCYISAYSCDTNQLLDVSYVRLNMEQPFLDSGEAAVFETFDASKITEDTYKLKVIVLDSVNMLQPVCPVTEHADEWTVSKTYPQYYFEEAYRLIHTVDYDTQHSEHQYLIFGAVTDSHVGIDNAEEPLAKESIRHGAYALDFISDKINNAFIVNLGDNTWENNIDSDLSYSGAQYTIDTLQPAFQNHQGFHLVGNHDQTDDISRQWELFGQYNAFDQIGITKERCYGYKDFTDKKVRVIFLNTSDYLNGTGSYGISYEQRDFLMSA